MYCVLLLKDFARLDAATLGAKHNCAHADLASTIADALELCSAQQPCLSAFVGAFRCASCDQEAFAHILFKLTSLTPLVDNGASPGLIGVKTVEACNRAAHGQGSSPPFRTTYSSSVQGEPEPELSVADVARPPRAEAQVWHELRRAQPLWYSVAGPPGYDASCAINLPWTEVVDSGPYSLKAAQKYQQRDTDKDAVKAFAVAAATPATYPDKRFAVQSRMAEAFVARYSIHRHEGHDVLSATQAAEGAAFRVASNCCVQASADKSLMHLAQGLEQRGGTTQELIEHLDTYFKPDIVDCASGRWANLKVVAGESFGVFLGRAFLLAQTARVDEETTKLTVHRLLRALHKEDKPGDVGRCADRFLDMQHLDCGRLLLALRDCSAYDSVLLEKSARPAKAPEGAAAAAAAAAGGRPATFLADSSTNKMDGWDLAFTYAQLGLPAKDLPAVFKTPEGCFFHRHIGVPTVPWNSENQYPAGSDVEHGSWRCWKLFPRWVEELALAKGLDPAACCRKCADPNAVHRAATALGADRG
jgi:hypothetical protein